MSVTHKHIGRPLYVLNIVQLAHFQLTVTSLICRQCVGTVCYISCDCCSLHLQKLI